MIMQYSINTKTNKVTSSESLGANFRKGDWRTCTDQEITAYDLQEARDTKISELKANRDTANLKPMVSIQAKEIAFDGTDYTTTANDKYFEFNVKSTSQPATEPNSIILGTLLAASVDPSYQLRYSANIIEGANKRRGYVAITGSVALNIKGHIENRTTTNIAHCNQVEDQIEACNTLEEVNAIDVTF